MYLASVIVLISFTNIYLSFRHIKHITTSSDCIELTPDEPSTPDMASHHFPISLAACDNVILLFERRRVVLVRVLGDQLLGVSPISGS